MTAKEIYDAVAEALRGDILLTADLTAGVADIYDPYLGHRIYIWAAIDCGDKRLSAFRNTSREIIDDLRNQVESLYRERGKAAVTEGGAS